jgi:transposase
MARNRKLKGGIMDMDRVREFLKLKEKNQSQREISEATGVSRSTLQMYLWRARELGITYEKSKELSNSELQLSFGKKSPGRKRDFAEQGNASILPAVNFEQIHHELAKHKGLTLELLWKEWRSRSKQEEGRGLKNKYYSYSTFCRRYREWRKQTKVTIRHQYYGGEKLLSDFAGVTVSYYKGDSLQRFEKEKVQSQIFVAVLGASNFIYCEALADQKLASWIGAHSRTFEFLGGVTQAVVIDNLKSGVSKACRYEPEITRSFQEWADHYGTTVMATRVRKPQDKAKVEKAVQIVEQRILAPIRNMAFLSIAHINQAILPLLKEVNAKPMQDYQVCREELFCLLDKPALKPLPLFGFSHADWKMGKVHPDYHVSVDFHWYSVPYQLVSKEVQIKITEKLIEVFHNNERITSHVRSYLKYRHSTLSQHLPPEHVAIKEYENKHGFVIWGKSVGIETEKLVIAFLNAPRFKEQSYRSLLGVKRLSEKYGSVALEQVATVANERNIVSQRFIRKLLEQKFTPQQSSQKLAAALASSHQNIRGKNYYN